MVNVADFTKDIAREKAMAEYNVAAAELERVLVLKSKNGLFLSPTQVALLDIQIGICRERLVAAKRKVADGRID